MVVSNANIPKSAPRPESHVPSRENEAWLAGKSSAAGGASEESRSLAGSPGSGRLVAALQLGQGERGPPRPPKVSPAEMQSRHRAGGAKAPGSKPGSRVSRLFGKFRRSGQFARRSRGHAQRRGYASAISRVAARAVVDVPLLDEVGSVAHGTRRVGEQRLLL